MFKKFKKPDAPAASKPADEGAVKPPAEAAAQPPQSKPDPPPEIDPPEDVPSPGDAAQLEMLLQNLQSKTRLYTHRREETQALLDLTQGARLLMDQHYHPYIVFETPEMRLVMGVKSAEFKRQLSTLYQNKYSRAPQRVALSEAVREIETRAAAEGEVVEVHLRRALTPHGLWLDLGDNQGRVVEICKQGWRVVGNPPVYFKRYQHQRPLPVPEPGGDIEMFYDMLPVKDPGDRMLLMAWMMAAYNPKIPVPMLVLTGPKGSGKTTLARILRGLIDPSRAEMMNLPPEAVFAQVLEHHAVPVFDNLGALRPQQANLLCRGVTGFSLVKRRNYTDSDDVILGERRPMIITALEPPSDAPDWMDRALVLRLAPIQRGSRFEEMRMMGSFEREWAKHLGLMMSRLSAAYAVYKSMPLPRDLPRMADFAVWGQALVAGLGVDPKMFLAALERNSYFQNEALLERDETGQAVLQFMHDKAEWNGTVQELLTAMQTMKHIRLRQSPTQLGMKLRRIQSNLLQSGISIESCRKEGIRTIILKSNRPQAPQTQ